MNEELNHNDLRRGRVYRVKKSTGREIFAFDKTEGVFIGFTESGWPRFDIEFGTVCVDPKGSIFYEVQE